MRVPTILLGLALFAQPVVAQGWIEPAPGWPETGVVKVRTAVSARIVGRVAEVVVEEWFENRGGRLGEGDYLYPLPGEAIFSNYSLFQGDQELRGETMDATQARAIYEEIVRRKKDPALIELVGHGLVRARVFPINPGETRKIILRYSQVLGRAGDALQFRYAAGGRWTPGRTRVEGHRTPQAQPSSTPVTIRVTASDAAAFGEPFSPTHDVRVRRDDDRLTVQPKDDFHGDFELFFPLADEAIGITVATHKPNSEDGYFMLTLSPNAAYGSTLPRDITAVVDVSGSMSGGKLEQAKAALHQLIGSLSRNDRFRLIAFSSRVSTFSNDWSVARGRAPRNARRWIDGLDANGGTNIEGALTEAFRATSSDARIPMVIFLTDGLPSVGEENPERLAARAERDRGETRVFAFGVGYDVNTYLLDRLSDAGRGSTQYVRPGDDVEVAVGHMISKIQHPVLADLGIDESPVDIDELYPERLPDLFTGEELTVFGRYRAIRRDVEGPLSITGNRNARGERYETDVTFRAHASENGFIPRLWAARKLGFLTQSLRLNGANPELEDEIRRTAMRYGLLSEYTSYLVQEPQFMALDESRRVAGRGMGLVPVRIGSGSNAPSVAKATSGETAVTTAEQARARREARSQADVDTADLSVLGGVADGPHTRYVAGRLFMETNGVWTDLHHSDSLDVIEIAPYSDAYFRLLERAPELEAYLTEFQQVLIAGVRSSIRITDVGATSLSPLALARLVRAFRGV